MIKYEIDIRNKENSTIRVSGRAIDIQLELYELFDKLDENCQAIFRAAVFAYINTNKDMLREYERVTDTPLSKFVMSIIRESKDIQ